MPNRAPTLLRQCALDRKTGVVEIQERIHRFHLFARQQFSISTIQNHAIAASCESIALGVGVDQVHDATLADHGIVVEVLLQPFPQLQ